MQVLVEAILSNTKTIRMTKFCHKLSQSNHKRKIRRRALMLMRCIVRLWDKYLTCFSHKPSSHDYLVLSFPRESSSHPATVVPPAGNDRPRQSFDMDLVALKITLLGDCHVGKTSFLAKYVGGDEEKCIERKGLNSMDKTLFVKGARISYSLWEVDGDEGSVHQIPMACKDSVAIVIMFDLTSRVTLNGVIRWFREARKWNQTAIPVIVGTKFDDFIQLPIDLQWTIASQARAYAKALNATLFFSSATYNINVNKIFKFITARLFDRPWTIERNLTIGEPIIDY